MKVYAQGEVDFFCGVYAVLNACRRAISRDYHFSYYGGCAFFRHLMQSVIADGKMEELLHHGTNIELMVFLLDKAVDYIRLKTGIELTYHFPYIDTELSVSEMARDLGEKLKTNASACILWMHDNEVDEHWTTVMSKSGRRFRLLDSYNVPYLDIENCLWLPQRAQRHLRSQTNLFYPRVPKGKVHLMKCGVIFISKTST